MIKLLRADITRMWKTKPFWICVILSLAVSVVNSVGLTPGWEKNTSRILLDGCSNSVLFMAIFAALFLGTDYAHNTIHNKMIIGSRRLDIYFSELITVTLGGFLIALAELAPTLFTVCAFGKSLGMETNEFAFNMFIIFCALVAVNGIFTLFGMLISSKSANTAITITVTFVLIIGAAVIMSMLSQPETVTYHEITENGASGNTVTEPNPTYIKPGLKRNILTAVNDILPTGQIMQMETGGLHNKELMPLYSLGVLAVTTAAGVVVFRRKDLK